MPRVYNLDFCRTSAVILTFSNHRFSESCSSSRESALCKVRHVHPSSIECQNVAVVPAILKISNCVISLRPSLSTTSFKNVIINLFHDDTWPLAPHSSRACGALHWASSLALCAPSLTAGHAADCAVCCRALCAGTLRRRR